MEQKQQETTQQTLPGWPICIRWPATAPAATVAGKWRRGPDWQITATYDDLAELQACVMAAEVLAEVEREHGRP